MEESRSLRKGENRQSLNNLLSVTAIIIHRDPGINPHQFFFMYSMMFVSFTPTPMGANSTLCLLGLLTYSIFAAGFTGKAEREWESGARMQNVKLHSAFWGAIISNAGLEQTNISTGFNDISLSFSLNPVWFVSSLTPKNCKSLPAFVNPASYRYDKGSGDMGQ